MMKTMVAFRKKNMLFLIGCYFAFFYSFLYSQNTRTERGKSTQIHTNQVSVCENDSLFLSVLVADSLGQDFFYQWQIKEEERQDWRTIPNADMSFLQWDKVKVGMRFRCKAATSQACLIDTDCEGIIEEFAPKILPTPHPSYQISPASCGQKNASVEVKLAGVSTPYSLIWNNNSRQNTLHNIPAGKYYLQVKYGVGCTITDSVEVRQLSTLPEVKFKVTDAFCGKQNGEIQVLNPENQYYTYSWSTGEVTQSIRNLQIGKYQIAVKNAFGCTKDTIVTISQISYPSFISYEKQDASCGLANGQIRLQVTGKGSPYRYVWNNGDTSSSLLHLKAGFYYAKIKDNLGCEEISDTILIFDNKPFKPKLKISPPTCKEKQDGKIEIKLPQPDSCYLFVWTDGEVSKNRENLTEGKYEVTIKYLLSGCETQLEAMLNSPSPINIEAIDIPDSLHFALKINVTGGIAPYIYALNDTTNYQPFSLFDSLDAGQYQIFVQDANACTKMLQHTIIPIVGELQEEDIIYIPNNITPNGDGKSDDFSIKSPNLADAYIQILNTQGILVHEGWQSEDTWKGSFEGTFCAEGVYYYLVKLEYADGKKKALKGSVRLLR